MDDWYFMKLIILNIFDFITIFRTSLLPNNGDQIVKQLWNQILLKIAKMMVTLLPYFKVSVLASNCRILSKKYF